MRKIIILSMISLERSYAGAWKREESNIPLAIVDNNEQKDGGIIFYISYVGPLGGQGSNKRVKVDISRSEELVFDPAMKDVINNYLDLDGHRLL